MLKRASLILMPMLFIVFLATCAHAEKVWYDGWVHSGDTFKVESNVYYVNYFEYERFGYERNKVLLKENDIGMVLKLDKDPDDVLCTTKSEDPATYGVCLTKTDTKDLHCVFKGLKKYCIVSIDYSSANVKYIAGVEQPGLHIKIAEFKPTITASAKIEPGTLNKYDEAKISFELTNTGEQRSSSIDFQYTLPPGVDYISSSYLERYGRTFKWQGSLMPDQKITLKITIRAEEYMNVQTKANVSYIYQNTYFEILPGVTINVPAPYTFSDSISPSSDVIEQLTIYSYTITNKDETKDLLVSVRTKLPLGLDVISDTPGLMREDNYFIYKDNIKPGKDSKMQITLRGHYTGEYNISTYGEFNIKDEEYYEHKYQVYRITNNQLNPVIRISASSIESGEPATIKALVFNDKVDEDYINILGTIYCELFEKPVDINVSELMRKTNKLVLDRELVTPISNKPRTINVAFNGTFQTASRELRNFSTQQSFTITPVAGERFQITQTPEKTLVERGTNFTMKVSVKNTKPIMVSMVDVREEIPEGLSVAGGIVKSEMAFDDYEEKQAYIYKLNVPMDYNESSFVLTTNLLYQDYDLTANTTINVTAPVIQNVSVQINQTANQTAPAGNETLPPPPPPEKKSVWQFIKDFFARLFK